MEKVIIFGAQSLLGKECFSVFSQSKLYEVIPLSHYNYDLLNAEELKKAFSDHNPDIVINCAEFADIDAAEKKENEDLVYTLNCDAPEMMAHLCTKSGTKFIHFSTDHVFDGKEETYNEQSPVHPINVYGESKVEGELAIWEENPYAIIIRTGTLFGESSDNFVTQAISLAKKHRKIFAVDDEMSNFTSAKDVAESVFQMIEDDPEQYGVFHLFGKDFTSPAIIATKIIHILSSRSALTLVHADEAYQQAKRAKKRHLEASRGQVLPGILETFPSIVSPI